MHICTTFLLTCLLLLLGRGTAPGQLNAHRAIELTPEGRAIAPLPATGGYMLAAQIFSPTDFNYRLAIVRLDSNLQTVGIRRVGISRSLSVSRLIRLASGSYLGIGNSLDTNFQSLGLRLHIDSQGMPSVPHLHNIAGLETYLSDAVALPDSGYVIAGFGTDSLPSSINYLARMDAQGDTAWTLQLRSTTPTRAGRFGLTALARLPGGDLILAGSIWRDTVLQLDPAVFRIRPDGSVRWARQYPTPLIALTASVLTMNGDSILLVATAYDTSSSTGPHTMVMALDSAGQALWARHYTAPWPLSPSTITLDGQGSPLVLGTYDEDNYSAWMAMRLDPLGQPQWAHTYSVDRNGALLDALPGPGGMLLYGLGPLPNTGLGTHFLYTDAQGQRPQACPADSFTVSTALVPVQTLALTGYSLRRGDTLIPINLPGSSYSLPNQLICAATSADLASEGIAATLYPHPMQQTAILALPNTQRKAGTVLSIVDIRGRRVDMLPTIAPEGFELHRNGLPAGIYAYQILQNGQRVASGKLVLAD
jgi:hypothetical protein